MKKLITILAIMIVLVGAVFADTANLLVTTEVTEVAQTFKLNLKEVATGNNKATFSDSAAESVVESTPTTDDATITTNDMLTKDATVTFNVLQTTTDARKTISYTLSAVVEDLTLYELPDHTTPTNAQITANKFAADTPLARTITAVDHSEYYTHGDAGTSVAVNFLGTPVPANTEIATFTCTWTHNANAIPGFYRANVTLTITSGS